VDLIPLVRGDLPVHFGLYFILGLCALLALSSIRGLKPRAAPYFLTVAAVMAVGAADEIYQSFVPLRSSSMFDWMADVTGGVTAVYLASRGWGFVKQKLAKPELRN
jgi:VanZ family protein